MSEFLFATVAGVHNDGLSLIFDGTNTATTKHYKCNTTIAFSVGNRVKILRDSGTCVVEYIVGNPGGPQPVPETTFAFYINGVEFRSPNNTSWTTWRGTVYNTQGYDVTFINGLYYLTLNGNKVAYIHKYNDTILPSHNYNLNYDHFSIAGVQQNFYVGLGGSEWVASSDLNPSGYTLVYVSGSGYYFKLNGTNVAFFNASNSAQIEKDRNYT